jgi:hypothetical protein
MLSRTNFVLNIILFSLMVGKSVSVINFYIELITSLEIKYFSSLELFKV